MRFAFLLVLLFSSFTSHAAGEATADVTLSPTGDFQAKSKDVKGEAKITGDIVRAEKIVVNLRSLTTGLALRDKHAKEKYLDVNRFPHAILTKAVGKGGRGKGILQIRGIQKEVRGTYEISNGTLKAEFPIKLSDFGIEGVKYMGVGAQDDVVIRVSVPAK